MKVSEAVNHELVETLGHYIMCNGEIISDNGDNGLIRVEVIDDVTGNIVMYVNELEELDSVFEKWAENGCGIFLVTFDDCAYGEIDLIEVFVEDVELYEKQLQEMYAS